MPEEIVSATEEKLVSIEKPVEEQKENQEIKAEEISEEDVVRNINKQPFL